MTKTSMKFLLGAGTAAVIAAISLAPPTHAQGQPGYVSPMPQTQPGSMDQSGNPYSAQQATYPNPQQNAYAPAQPATPEPSQPRQSETRYPGPKLN